MNTFEEDLSYLLREWCWEKAWENAGQPRLFSDNSSLREDRGCSDKNREGINNMVYQRIRIVRYKWFPEGVYGLISIRGDNKRFLWACSKNNSHIIVSEWSRGGRGRVAVDVSNFTGESLMMSDEESDLLCLVHPWVKEAIRVISDRLRQF